MSSNITKEMLQTVLECLDLHMRNAEMWHFGDAVYESNDVPEVEGAHGFKELVMRQHWAVFRLHEVLEDGGSGVRAKRIAENRDELTEAIDIHLGTLLGKGGACLGIGERMERMSQLSLDAYHARKAAHDKGHEGQNDPRNARLARQVERLIEQCGELDTHRVVLGREMLDLLAGCGADSED